MLLPVASHAEDEVLSQINTTPLVDVMLVLLIIFLITIPVVTTSISLSLPREQVTERQARPENIIISVDRGGRIYWYDTPVVAPGDLVQRLRKVAVMSPQPDVQIRGDAMARYESIGTVMAACQLAGIKDVAFVTEPSGPGR
jgi:biopolymer transport protein ExbD